MPEISDSDLLRHLDEVDDWPGLVRRMIAYGIWLAKNEYEWRVGTILPKGNEIKDLVFAVIKKLYNRERTWDPSRVPLEIWLRNNIRSEMNNLFKAAYTTTGSVREIPFDPQDDETAPRLTQLQSADHKILSVESQNPEAILIERERRERRSTVIKALYKAIEGDELLESIYFELLDGCERKPQVLAEKLGVSTSEINNALRRLDRHVARIRKEMDTNDE